MILVLTSSYEIDAQYICVKAIQYRVFHIGQATGTLQKIGIFLKKIKIFSKM